MPDERDQMLRDMAAHRGLRLVKSRRRKPGGDFGRYGLTDAKTGQDCFGIGKDGLEASADEIEEYLRRGAKADWKRSLGAGAKSAAKPHPKPRSVRKERAPAPKRREPEPEPEPEPAPEPQLVVRGAKASDAEAIAALIGADLADVKAAIRRLVQAGEAPFVAEERAIVGCAAWHVVPALQHGAIGRITLLRVDAEARRRGVGTKLVEAVEARLAERGCSVLEAVSDIDLSNAHGFFRRMGFERTSYRFAKRAD